MPCMKCGPEHQTEFDAEMNVHFPGPRDREKGGRLAIPQAPGLLRLRLYGAYDFEEGIAESCRGGLEARPGVLSRHSL
jgi:hypothetical protein